MKTLIILCERWGSNPRGLLHAKSDTVSIIRRVLLVQVLHLVQSLESHAFCGDTRS